VRTDTVASLTTFLPTAPAGEALADAAPAAFAAAAGMGSTSGAGAAREHPAIATRASATSTAERREILRRDPIRALPCIPPERASPAGLTPDAAGTLTKVWDGSGVGARGRRRRPSFGAVIAAAAVALIGLAALSVRALRDPPWEEPPPPNPGEPPLPPPSMPPPAKAEPGILWERRWYGQLIEVAELAWAPDGSIAAACNAAGDVDLGGGHVHPGLGKMDIILVRLDPHGAVVASRRFGSAGYEAVRRVAVDDAGNVTLLVELGRNHYQVTRAPGAADFGKGVVTGDGNTFHVVSLDPSFHERWGVSFGAPRKKRWSAPLIPRFAASPDGSVVVAGVASEPIVVEGTETSGAHVTVPPADPRSSPHAVLARITSEGTIAWARTLGIWAPSATWLDPIDRTLREMEDATLVRMGQPPRPPGPTIGMGPRGFLGVDGVRIEANRETSVQGRFAGALDVGCGHSVTERDQYVSFVARYGDGGACVHYEELERYAPGSRAHARTEAHPDFQTDMQLDRSAGPLTPFTVVTRRDGDRILWTRRLQGVVTVYGHRDAGVLVNRRWSASLDTGDVYVAPPAGDSILMLAP
jgi:hypothetical protein